MEKLLNSMGTLSDDLAKIEIRTAIIDMNEVTVEQILRLSLALECLYERVIKLENVILRKQLRIAENKEHPLPEHSCLINRMDCPYVKEVAAEQ